MVEGDTGAPVVRMIAPNARGELGRTALHEAAVWGVRAVVEGVLRYTQGWELPWGSEAAVGLLEVDPTLIDRDGRTPLTLAATHGHADVVALLASPVALTSPAASASTRAPSSA